MKTKLAIAALSGVLMGITSATAIRGQKVKTPPGYLIAEAEVTDTPALRNYGQKVADCHLLVGSIS